MGQLFAAGASTDTSDLDVISPQDVAAGNEYIWEYGVPAVTFSVVSPDTVQNFVQGMFNLDSYIKQYEPGTPKPPVTITGISIDTSTGNIWVRGIVEAMPTDGTKEMGVNPWAIAGLIAGLFAILGAAITLRYVYELKQAFSGVTGQPGDLDPCTNPGIINYVRCLARESKWFIYGFAVALIAVVVFLLVKFGPREGIGEL